MSDDEDGEADVLSSLVSPRPAPPTPPRRRHEPPIITLPLPSGGAMVSPLGYAGGLWNNRNKSRCPSFRRLGLAAVLVVRLVFLIRKRRHTSKRKARPYLTPETHLLLCPGWKTGDLPPSIVVAIREEAAKVLRDLFVARIAIRIRLQRRQGGKNVLTGKEEVSTVNSLAQSDHILLVWWQTPLFELWPFGDVVALAKHALPVTYNAGEFVVYKGENPPGIYFLDRGVVAVLDRAEGVLLKISTITAPAVLCENSVVIGTPQNHFIRVVTPVVAHFLPAQKVHQALASLAPGVAEKVHARCTELRNRMITGYFPLTVETLTSSPLFASLPYDVLRKLMAITTPCTVKVGGHLLSPPSVPRMYFLKRGKCMKYLMVPGKSGKMVEVVLEEFEAPVVIGGPEMVGNEPAPRVRAVTDCDAWVLGKEDLMRFLEVYPHSRTAILNALKEMREGCLSIHILKAIPLYRAALDRGVLTENALLRLSKLFTARVFAEQTLIASAGTPCDRSIVLVKGVAHASYNGIERRVGYGECLGPSMLLPSRWVSSVLSMTSCYTWEISQSQLTAFLDQENARPQFERLVRRLIKDETLILEDRRFGAVDDSRASKYFPASGASLVLKEYTVIRPRQPASREERYRGYSELQGSAARRAITPMVSEASPLEPVRTRAASLLPQPGVRTVGLRHFRVVTDKVRIINILKDGSRERDEEITALPRAKLSAIINNHTQLSQRVREKIEKLVGRRVDVRKRIASIETAGGKINSIRRGDSSIGMLRRNVLDTFVRKRSTPTGIPQQLWRADEDATSVVSETSGSPSTVCSSPLRSCFSPQSEVPRKRFMLRTGCGKLRSPLGALSWRKRNSSPKGVEDEASLGSETTASPSTVSFSPLRSCFSPQSEVSRKRFVSWAGRGPPSAFDEPKGEETHREEQEEEEEEDEGEEEPDFPPRTGLAPMLAKAKCRRSVGMRTASETPASTLYVMQRVIHSRVRTKRVRSAPSARRPLVVPVGYVDKGDLAL